MIHCFCWWDNLRPKYHAGHEEGPYQRNTRGADTFFYLLYLEYLLAFCLTIR